MLSRALEMGAKLRNDPIHALKRLDNIYFAKSEEQVVVVDETKPQGTHIGDYYCIIGSYYRLCVCECKELK